MSRINKPQPLISRDMIVGVRERVQQVLSLVTVLAVPTLALLAQKLLDKMARPLATPNNRQRLVVANSRVRIASSPYYPIHARACF